MIAITAPTSHIGSQVLARLPARTGLRVIARNPGRLPRSVHDRAEVVPGSHSDPAVLRAALGGIDTVFWLVPPDPRTGGLEHYARFTDALCAVAADAGVTRVVAVSSLGRDYDGPAGLLSAAFAMDNAIEATGVAYRALRMPYFMENLLASAGAIREDGVMPFLNRIDRPLPATATRDIAAIAALTLLDGQWTGHDSIPVVGPDNLSPAGMADIATRVLGRTIQAVAIPAGEFAATMTGNGASQAWIQDMFDMIAAQDNGIYTAEAAAPRTATTFASWCADVLAPTLRAS